MAQDGMTRLLVIGGSAGSLEVLLQFLPGLDSDLPFPVLVVLHRRDGGSQLAALLETRTRLPVKEAEDKEQLLPGRIFLAPASYHLLIEGNGSMALDCSEKINYSRPSIDVTFEGAADVFGAAAAGLLLSGANHDGVEGLALIQKMGGAVAVQDPVTAQVAYMPQGAIDRLRDLRTLYPSEMAAWVNGLAMEQAH